MEASSLPLRFKPSDIPMLRKWRAPNGKVANKHIRFGMTSFDLKDHYYNPYDSDWIKHLRTAIIQETDIDDIPETPNVVLIKDREVALLVLDLIHMLYIIIQNKESSPDGYPRCKNENCEQSHFSYELKPVNIYDSSGTVIAKREIIGKYNPPCFFIESNKVVVNPIRPVRIFEYINDLNGEICGTYTKYIDRPDDTLTKLDRAVKIVFGDGYETEEGRRKLDFRVAAEIMRPRVTKDLISLIGTYVAG